MAEEDPDRIARIAEEDRLRLKREERARKRTSELAASKQKKNGRKK
jgi:hypothetical protein